jgi:alginate O-acetyltransferase complex protein AlgI
MAFNSVIFLFLFFPLFLGVYFLSPGKFKNIILIIFSLLFYSWGDKILVLLLVSSALINFGFGKLIHAGYKKPGLILSILFNITLLSFFKYADFLIESAHEIVGLFRPSVQSIHTSSAILLPLGISFYTFRAISYSIDVSRNKINPGDGFIRFLTYFTMFPLILAGPIVRYSDIQTQLGRKNISISKFSEGLERFIIGLAKKVIIAGTFSSIAAQIFQAPVSEISTLFAWIGIIAFTFEIYFDFSGYSDMAIGLGKMIGFDFPENFNFPYTSKSIREFWRRWHVTLSTWLRDYLFLPIAYSLSGKLPGEHYFKIKTEKIIYVLATLVTFLICGLWHGAAWHFVAWGLYFSIFLILEQLFLGRMLKKLWNPIQHAYTVLIVTCSWVIFKADSLHDAFNYFGKLFSFSQGFPAMNSYLKYFTITHETIFITLAAILFSMPVYARLRAFAGDRGSRNHLIQKGLTWTGILALGSLFIICLTYMAANTYNPFIYFRF